MEIRGKTFIVTGGRSGLGEASAAMLEREGAKVVIADLPETDVTNEDAVRSLVDSCDELHGVVAPKTRCTATPSLASLSRVPVPWRLR